MIGADFWFGFIVGWTAAAVASLLTVVALWFFRFGERR